MKNIDRMLKCRAIFIYNIGLIFDDFSFIFSEELAILLEGFLNDYFGGVIVRSKDGTVMNNYEAFNLIYYFTSDENDNLMVMEEPEWDIKLNEYLEFFLKGNKEKVLKIYDEIGYEDIDKITELVSLFKAYVLALNDMYKLRVRS
jgi:hypothetical protein